MSARIGRSLALHDFGAELDALPDKAREALRRRVLVSPDDAQIADDLKLPIDLVRTMRERLVLLGVLQKAEPNGRQRERERRTIWISFRLNRCEAT